jgi:hypothetical protein
MRTDWWAGCVAEGGADVSSSIEITALLEATVPALCGNASGARIACIAYLD